VPNPNEPARAAEASPAAWAGRRLHFVGIGGAGMSGIALVARALGAGVTGSDRAESAYVARLREAGIEPTIGHDARNLPDGDDVELVYSTAVGPDNPERALARERGLAELHRADVLAELTALRPTIAITGTHGKTTTAAMAVHALRGAGADPGYLVGGEVRCTGSNAGWGAGEWLVVEADESDRSMLKLHPAVALVTNVELDHHATYASRLDLEEAFGRFLALAPRRIVWDRPQLVELAVDAGDGEVVTFDAPDPQLRPGGVRFGWRGHDVVVDIPGAHNARNAAAALEVCRAAGADLERAVAALAGFHGAGRRFERLGATATGAAVYDDYAHHPTEVAATIAAARTLEPRRLVAVFQPHLYSRTRGLYREFGATLARADVVVVLDVYPARERAEDYPGVSGHLIAAATADAAAGRPVYWLPDFATAEPVLRDLLGEGDLCLVMGAGDVDALGRRLVAGG
jgi:UDP-N-acetylmuramate--alanine ligase